MSVLGKYIADQRMAKNLSKRKLAELAKISHTEIHRLENGERKHPSPFVLKSIALALNLNFNDIMKVAGYLDDDVSTSTSPIWLSEIDDLSEEELDEVRDFIDFLRNKRKKKQ
ncbi:helix-turn-helix domain-containing protein [Hazenella coriacea]|uniref:Transcriptional regulator with XRE-family HTH domain n=1 Tax=Hazenella coriacea TaxID=1179467 RepID=A0A4R3L7W9_9BACL|nr:helix-turn-helix transcriptional regulator [Hazenella coriacea]TCS95883.1 transcriptional regulator with XRE-family HTH domain [Hazenella coriacea]